MIIVGVVDGERLLVTKYAPSHAAAKYFALVAGFCEIGETAEDTVRREVWEEVGLRVKHIRYYGSQPWGSTGTFHWAFLPIWTAATRSTWKRMSCPKPCGCTAVTFLRAAILWL